MELTEDLLYEILSRLPVKSLLRFRCVSKPWLALVDDDADFARLHLNTFKNNRDQTRLFVVRSDPRIFEVGCAETLESICQIPSPYNKNWNIVSSVDGLVLLKYFTANDSLKLWNPSLRRFHQVPPAPKTYKRIEFLGFGYDLLAKNYKIVMLIYGFGIELPSVGIYTVGASSWKIIPIQYKGSSSFVHEFLLVCSEYLKGSLYFLTMEVNNLKEVVLWSFDLSNEVFSRVTMPGDIVDPVNLHIFLVHGGFSLAMSDDHGYSMWVLERESMNWTKRILRRTRYDWILHKKNSDMLIIKIMGNVIGIAGEVALYCPGKDEYKILQQITSRNWINHASTYVESLVLNKLNRA